MRTGGTEIAKLVQHHACVPILTARQMSGRNFHAIPMGVFQRMPDGFSAKFKLTSNEFRDFLTPCRLAT